MTGDRTNSVTVLWCRRRPLAGLATPSSLRPSSRPGSLCDRQGPWPGQHNPQARFLEAEPLSFSVARGCPLGWQETDAARRSWPTRSTATT